MPTLLTKPNPFNVPLSQSATGIHFCSDTQNRHYPFYSFELQPVADSPLCGIFIPNVVLGLNTSIKRAEECAHYFQTLGYGCGARCMGHLGTRRDLSRAANELYGGMATHLVEELHRRWYEFIAKAPIGTQNLTIGYSEGAIVIRNALMSFPAALRNRLRIRLFAPAAYISPDLGANVKHYRSRSDIVPLLDHRGRKGAAATTRALPAAPSASLWDHNFMSETFTHVMQVELFRYSESIRWH